MRQHITRGFHSMHTRVRSYSWSGGLYSYSTAVIMTWRSHGSRSRPARRGKGSTARRRDWRARSFLLLKPPLSLPPPPPFSALPCRPSLAVSVCPRAPHFLPLVSIDPTLSLLSGGVGTEGGVRVVAPGVGVSPVERVAWPVLLAIESPMRSRGRLPA